MKTWTTPGGMVPAICVDMLEQPHLLIAGATGSGKSVLINSLIYTALHFTPNHKQFILIDPKRVELIDYAKLPHTPGYYDRLETIITALTGAVATMETRYSAMQRKRLKQSAEPHIYIIIDEYADLVVQAKKQVEPLIIRLAQLGRAANMHLILATQRPTRDIITGAVKVNMDSRVALRCPSPQDSRNIIDTKGAETLPKYGQGYYRTSDGLDVKKIPYTSPDKLAAVVDWWTQQNKGFFKNLLGLPA
jgi:DNA segregation ATPase FtsK/SpoIIIE and related proteins